MKTYTPYLPGNMKWSLARRRQTIKETKTLKNSLEEGSGARECAMNASGSE
jgi:hypothetical protein